jgi:hypothetical protein
LIALVHASAGTYAYRAGSAFDVGPSPTEIGREGGEDGSLGRVDAPYHPRIVERVRLAA